MAVTVTYGRRLPALKEIKIVSTGSNESQAFACRGFTRADFKLEAIAGGGTVDLRRYTTTESTETLLESVLADVGGAPAAAVSAGDEPVSVSIKGAAKILVIGATTTSYTARLTLRAEV